MQHSVIESIKDDGPYAYGRVAEQQIPTSSMAARSLDNTNSTDLSKIYCVIRVDQTAYRNR